MKPLSRRKFLLSGLSLIPVPFLATYINPSVLKLSFSTLGCPDWRFDDILSFASEHGYSGIEVRGILHEMDLTKVPEFSSVQQIADTLKKMKDRNLVFTDLGSSASMHLPDGPERIKNLDEGKRFIDLASKLECPNIRVFPNQLPKDRDRQQTLDLIAKGLRELGDYAKGTKVHVLLESHGEVIYKKDLKSIMDSAGHEHVGLVWDICNMWSVTKETPAEVYDMLHPYILHTHIKDLEITAEGKEKYVLLGKGVAPIFTAVDILYKHHYAGYYSFEWEKLWHPEIAAPEIALADYPLAMKKHFNL
ncbi:MAG: sugar phosphate isomerase/epimerase family protein [Bacteroidota bacterium]|nr:sugar phosphate isomerase/epimerase family protein [Bacteroidota bacterium]MDP4213763.1 sugar phosphate isomerase/epimerase family protein [Bacteroidota bacterium]MDP4250157.1 sugar phosphate isomerase/epimerase family protein [Bacteroidota bacterium]